jgi:hypothetical protein
VLDGNHYRLLPMFIYMVRLLLMTTKMVDNNDKSKDANNTNARLTTDATTIYDTLNENLVKFVNEWTKAQPQYSQAISNLQLDYIDTTRNIINTAISFQKAFNNSNNNSNWNPPVATPYVEQFTKQSNEVVNSMIRTAAVNNQLTTNMLDAARENLRSYNKTIDAVTEFNTSAAKAWNSFFSTAAVQSRQFFKQ